MNKLNTVLIFRVTLLYSLPLGSILPSFGEHSTSRSTDEGVFAADCAFIQSWGGGWKNAEKNTDSGFSLDQITYLQCTHSMVHVFGVSVSLHRNTVIFVSGKHLTFYTTFHLFVTYSAID